MEIVSTWHRRVAIPLHTTFAISSGALTAVDSVLVGIGDASGRLGIGEAAPFPVLTHDTGDRAAATVAKLLAELPGRSLTDALAHLYNELWQPASAVSITACVAVEMALLDLRAQEQQVLLRDLFGSAALPGGETDITLPILDRSELAAFWQRFGGYGFPYVKVKVGGDSVAADVERVLTLLRLAAPGTRVSLDGNQGCSQTSARQLLHELERAGVTPLLFEQPLPADDLAGLAALTAAVPIPVCADESVRTAADARRIVEQRAARMINLKFMKSGIAESQRIATIARQAGLDLMIGGMVESEVAMTASLHFLCGTGQVAFCDLDTPFFFSTSVTASSPYDTRRAQLVLPQRPGLGLTLRPEFIGNTSTPPPHLTP